MGGWWWSEAVAAAIPYGYALGFRTTDPNDRQAIQLWTFLSIQIWIELPIDG